MKTSIPFICWQGPKAWALPRFWVSIRSYKKQPVKIIWGRTLGLALLKFAMAPLDYVVKLWGNLILTHNCNDTVILFLGRYINDFGRSSLNGVEIYDSQFRPCSQYMMRIEDCFWMGKPCGKNYPKFDFRPLCNDPDVNFCSAKLMTTYQNETDTFKNWTPQNFVDFILYPSDYLVCLTTNDKRCKLSDVRCLIC